MFKRLFPDERNRMTTIATVDEHRFGSLDGQTFILLNARTTDVAREVRDTLDWIKREPAQAVESIVGPYDRALLVEEGATFEEQA